MNNKETKMEENTTEEDITKDLSSYYKYVYKCKCGKEYGSDKKENKEHVCPECESKFKKTELLRLMK